MVLAYLLAAAVLFEFPALLPVRIVDPGLRIVGSVGVALAGGLAAFFGARMFFMGARIPGALLLVLGASKLLLIDAAIADALLAWGMCIPYLHLLLAGLVTTVLLEHAQARWPATFGAAPIKSAIAAMLVGLWPTTALWPLMVSRELGLIFTALTALLPVVAVGWMLRPRSPGVPLREGRSPCPR